MSTPPTDHPATNPPETTKTAINLGRIVLFGVGLALVSLIALAWYNGAWQLWATGGVTFVTALAAVASIILMRRGRPHLAAWILIGSSEAAFLLGNILIAGVSWVLAILLPAVAITVSYLLLPPQNRRWMNASAVFASILLLATDYLHLPFRFNLPNNLQIALQIVFGITLVVLLVYITQIIRAVRARLVIAFLVVALTPLGILAIINTRALESHLKKNANEQLRVIASQSAANLDVFIQTNLDVLRTEAQISDLTDMLVSPGEHPGILPKVEAILTAFNRRDQVNILSYSLFNLSGIDVADSFSANEGNDISNLEYFKQTLRAGLPTLSPVFYKDNSFYFSAPVRDSAHETVGVLRIQYNASVLQQIIAQSTNLSGPGSFAMLLDENHIFLANGAQPEIVFKSLVPLDTAALAKLQSAGQLPNGTADQFSANLPAIEDGLQSGQSFLTIQESSASENKKEPTANALAIASMTTRPWVVIYSLEQDILLAPVQRQTLTTTLLALLISLAAAISALALAQTLTSPLIKLAGIAQEVTQGNIQAYATATSNDEFGILANAFNSMTARLRDLISGLEQRVAERTADLEQATLQSGKRAEELQVVSEVARAVSTEVNLENLLTLVTNLVSERFGFYHVGVFLLDPVRDNAVLRASNSPGGKRMIARGHKLPVGQVGIVGYVAASHEARIALNVGEDAVFFNNPDMPETRSEMALPLRLHGRILGVLDAQSIEANAFTEKDVETIGILADQVAIAIENARLISESRQALAESQSLYGDFINRAWERKTEQSALGYYHAAGAGHLINEPVEWDEVQNALKTGRMVVATPARKSDTQATISAVAVPIRLQNQVIGILDIRSADPDRAWTEDEIAVIEATAERLALALENARLFEETSGRAAREHAVAEITSRIRETNDPQVMIRTAIEELQHVLNVSRVEIIPQVVSAHLPGRENNGQEAG